MDTVKVAKAYLEGANLFYSGQDKKQYFKYLTDDFEWIVGSKSFKTKQAFIDSNEAAFGAVTNVFGHHELISLEQATPHGPEFVIVKLSTFVQQNQCSEWFENIDIFIFNQKKQIKQAIAVFIDEKEYTAKQMKVNNPDCIKQEIKKNTEKNNGNKMKEILNGFMNNVMENNDGKYEGRIDEYEMIGYSLLKRFDVDEINNLTFKQYGIGDDTISGFMYVYVKKGECQLIQRDFVVLYINEQDKINKIVEFPVESDPNIRKFKQCVQKQEL